MADKQVGPGLYVKLGLDYQGIIGGVGGISLALNQTLEVFQKFEGAAQGFLDLANKTADFVSQIDKLSITTGMSTDELQRWSNVARYADSDIGSLAATINKYQINLRDQGEVGEKVRGILDRMGVSYKNADGSIRSMNELFPATIAGLSNLKLSGDRVTAANVLFGRSYQDMAGYMTMSREEMEKYYSSASVLTEDQKRKIREYEAACKDLDGTIQNLNYTIGAELSGSFSTWGSMLDDLLQQGQPLNTFFKELNLFLQMTAEGFTILGGTMANTFELAATRDFDVFQTKMGQLSRDVNIMRDRFAHPEAYENETTKTPGSVSLPPTSNVSNTLALKGTAFEKLSAAIDKCRSSFKELNDEEKKYSDLRLNYLEDVKFAGGDVSKIRNLTMNYNRAARDQQRRVSAAESGLESARDAAKSGYQSWLTERSWGAMVAMGRATPEEASRAISVTIENINVSKDYDFTRLMQDIEKYQSSRRKQAGIRTSS